MLEAALSALQRFLDSEFSIQHGVGPCKRDASPRFGRIDKDDPFPATWICRLNDFKLDGFVFHGRSSKRRHRKFLGLPRNECRLHVQPLSINIGNHRRRCSDDGKGHDRKSKSDEFQTVSVRHFSSPQDRYRPWTADSPSPPTSTTPSRRCLRKSGATA